MDPVVILSSDTVSVGPGQEARLPVRVRNQGRRVESYRVEVVGAPAAFARVDPATVSVLPGREAEVDVWFNPPAGASTPTGALPFAVRATSEVEASSSAAAEGHIELSGVAGLQAWCANTSRKARWKAEFPLEFANHGNAAVRVAVVAHDPSGEVLITVSEEVVDLQPGGRTTSTITAKARQPFLRGNAVNRIIQARCQSLPFGAERPEPGAAPPHDDPNSRTFQLTMVQRPILSKVVIIAAVLLIGLLAAFVVLRLRGEDEVALGLAAPEAPTEFTAAAQGSTEILLEWSKVPNAVGYQVRPISASGEPGAALGEGDLDAATLTFPVTELEPSTEHCFAIVAVGPEGAGNSQATEPQCATTAAPSRLRRPTDLEVNPIGGGTFELTWKYRVTEGVEFQVLADGNVLPNQIVGTSGTIELPQGETESRPRIAVRAVRGDEVSDPSKSVEVVVEPLPVTVTTTVTTVAPTVAPPPGQTTVVPIPVPPVTPPGGTTPTPTTDAPTTPAPTTTIPPGAVQGVLQDIPRTWAAVRVDPPVFASSEGGLGVDASKASLAAALGIDPSEVKAFFNRDTVATDRAGQPAFETSGERSDVGWLYIEAGSRNEARDRCASVPGTCRALLVEGAAAAAERTGATVAVLNRLPADTALADVDAALVARREALGRTSVFVLDGAAYQGFSAGELVIYAPTTPGELNTVCAAIAPEPCPQLIVLVPGTASGG